MKRILLFEIFLLVAACHLAAAIQIPSGLFSIGGDQSIVLQWYRNTDANLAGYRVYRSTTGATGPFTLITPSLLTAANYCDVSLTGVVNGRTNFYYVTAMDTGSQESLPSPTNAVLP